MKVAVLDTWEARGRESVVKDHVPLATLLSAMSTLGIMREATSAAVRAPRQTQESRVCGGPSHGSFRSSTGALLRSQE